jgi:amino acid adenylation domain-containing protein/non-ribosomal peptide synthase protein (TIGR01720 family)
VLDQQLQLVPIGVPGELFIGGDGLARGYLNRPELTAERFIPNPFGTMNEERGTMSEGSSASSFPIHRSSFGERLYRTGDLARYQPDGAIEYLGRLDCQVKVRGFRIELGEIEAVLRQHPSVHEAVVLGREDAPGAVRLVAYIISNDERRTINDENNISSFIADRSSFQAELRAFLQGKLPDHMLPAAFVFLETWPLTPNGKVDRRALPAPDRDRAAPESVFVAPRTPVEGVLAGIWAELLGQNQIGVHDNFFALGGHSLLATQVLARLRAAFQIELGLHSLFEAPTIAGLARQIEQALKAEQGLHEPPIATVVRDGVLPLSFAQQRLWFLDQLEPGSPTYNMPAAVRLSGALDTAALESSLNAIVGRHEVLRTTFTTVEGQPSQLIAPILAIRLSIVNLEGMPAAERELEAQRLAADEARLPFDLAHGPLLRATLLRLDVEEHVLLLTMHHIISDGWSIGVLMRELAALYSAGLAGRQPALPILPIQYADYAHWQRAWLQGQVLDTQLAYWKQQLAGAPALLELPTDRPRPPVQTFQGAHQAITLPQPLTAAIKKLSQREGVTPFMTLLAAFQTMLYRYTGQTDLVVGTPIANRTRTQTEPLIGFFVNTLVLRASLSRSLTFQELLGRVRRICLDAYAHQDLPFEHLVAALDLDRSLSYAPLFQVLFALQNAPMATIDLPGLRLSPVAVESGTAKCDLALLMEETEQGFLGVIEYNTDLFDAATIARMLGHFQAVLAGVVADPAQPLADVPLLTTAEREQILLTWNDIRAPYPGDTLIHQVLEDHAVRTPNAVAVSFEDQQVTYAELNRRANQLARHLRARGVGPEVLVGICMERSPEMLVAVIGTLKAGGAYLPLDPAYPWERLAFMLKDSQAALLLTQQRLATGLPPHAAQVVCVDADWPAIAQEDAANPARVATVDNLAYVIYTSGSTGQPKGVQITHRGLCNLAEAQAQAFDVRPDSRVLQFAAFSFDASVAEVFATFWRGATLCLARPESLLAGPALIQLIRELAITIVTLPPSALSILPADAFPALRTVVSAGESCSAHIVACWAPGRRFINAYGPTEATVCATLGECTADGLRPSIGRPIANVQLYLLDQHLQPVPIGVPGELYIGGVGLARGYLNHPELTAERFVPNPFGTSNEERGTMSRDNSASSFIIHRSSFGDRLYRTGDLARYRPDGTIEYLGRNDRQVKLRGFRVELGEIEALLDQHPGVRESMVLAREDGPSGRWLVAYVVPNGERGTMNDESDGSSFIAHRSSFQAELRDFLKERLPGYMLPAAFVFLETWPLMPNGKVDRRALPAPDRDRAAPESAFVAPRTPAEEILAAIWAQVLGVAQVGIHDNFFACGGDSILSIQIVAKANAAGLRITPKQLFEYQTIAALAAVAGAAEAIQAEQGRITGALPLTPIQRWFFDQDLPDRHHWNQAVLLETRQALDFTLLERALEHILQHHDALRLRFTHGETGWQQFNADSVETMPLVRIDLSGLPAAEQPAAITAAAARLHTSMDLAAGSLLRAALFDLGPATPGRLLIVIHHLAIDGVSWRILLEDLQTAYEQLRRGGMPQLPPKTTAYKRWAERLAEYADSAQLQDELDYWLAAAQTPAASLPVDYPADPAANLELSARTISVSLEVEETQALLHDIPAAYHTQINDVLLTALLQAMAEWTGARRMLVDLEGHGREDIFADIDLSRTVGWCTTLFPVLLDLEQAACPEEELQAVKEQLRRVPRHGIGYGVLRYLSQAESARLVRLAPAEVSFNYLGQFDQQGSQSVLFGAAHESSGPSHGPGGRRRHMLEINGSIVAGRLQVGWTYSERLHRRATIAALAECFIAALRTLIAHCQSPEAGGYTPSDFALAGLDQEELGALAALLAEPAQV